MPLHTRSDQSQILVHEECIMKKVLLLIVLFLPFPAYAQQAPFGRPDIPISSRDRVYAADQTSNTVSVIDPSRNELLGVIRLGNPVPGSLSPLYTAQLLSHGLVFSPESKTVAVVSVASNSVTLIDTATNAVKGTVYVGRSPHEAFFTPDGSELRVTVRGLDYVSGIDPLAMKEIRRIQTVNGPTSTTSSSGVKLAQTKPSLPSVPNMVIPGSDDDRDQSPAGMTQDHQAVEQLERDRFATATRPSAQPTPIAFGQWGSAIIRPRHAHRGRTATSSVSSGRSGAKASITWSCSTKRSCVAF